MTENVNWVTLKGYSIENQLQANGLSFGAFEIVDKTFGKEGLKKLRKKIVGRLGSELRQEFESESKTEKDLNNISNGCYCIGLGGDFKISYSKKFSSRIVYIGSGRVFSRIKSHLTERLFDFAQAMPGVPLQFHICDLDETNFDRKVVEQCLLDKFYDMSRGHKPLLNQKDAKANCSKPQLPSGWDKPIQKDRGPKNARWLIQPTDFNSWKGALD